MSQIDQDMAGAVGAVTRRYARRCWWVEIEDVRQHAWLYAHQARVNSGFDPALSKTGNIKPLIKVAAARNVQRLVLQTSAPVSAPDKKRHDLRRLTRVSIDEAGTFAAHDDQARQFEVEQWRAQVTVRLRELAGTKWADDLLDGEGASKNKVDTAMLKALAQDEELRRLWREKPDVILGDLPRFSDLEGED